MQIHITRSGQSFGPYTLDEVNAYLQSGHLSGADMAWYEGAAGWLPLSQVQGVQAPASAPPPPPTPLPAVPQPAQPPVQLVVPAVSPNSAPAQAAPEEESTIFEITPTLAPEIVLSVLTCGFGLLRLIPKAILNQGCKYKLTTQRLLLTTGLIGRHVEECELYRVQDVTASQGMIGRMLGYGTVVVHVRDVTTPQLTLANINQPLKVKEQIREQMRRAKRSEGMRPVEFG